MSLTKTQPRSPASFAALPAPAEVPALPAPDPASAPDPVRLREETEKIAYDLYEKRDVRAAMTSRTGSPPRRWPRSGCAPRWSSL